MKPRNAFTLIELLIVVSVIAILAAISVPNFLEAQVRSKVARARTDMAAVRMALRSYYADFNRYPANNPDLHAFLQAAAKVEVPDDAGTPTPSGALYSWTRDDPGFRNRPGHAPLRVWLGSAFSRGDELGTFPVLHTGGIDLIVLTTPIAYATSSLPVDPFHDSRNMPFLYLHTASLSAGDDQVTSRIREAQYLLLSYGPDTDSGKPNFPNPATGPFVPYDPTNGTVSVGELTVTARTP